MRQVGPFVRAYTVYPGMLRGLHRGGTRGRSVRVRRAAPGATEERRRVMNDRAISWEAGGCLTFSLSDQGDIVPKCYSFPLAGIRLQLPAIGRVRFPMRGFSACAIEKTLLFLSSSWKLDDVRRGIDDYALLLDFFSSYAHAYLTSLGMGVDNKYKYEDNVGRTGNEM